MPAQSLAVWREKACRDGELGETTEEEGLENWSRRSKGLMQ
jgi:hypothetical protein